MKYLVGNVSHYSCSYSVMNGGCCVEIVRCCALLGYDALISPDVS